MAKFFEFHQISDTKTVKCLCCNNVYYGIIVFFIAYQCLTSAMMCFNGLYYYEHNTVEAILYFCYAVNILYVSYKMYTVIKHSKLISDCLSTTQLDIASYGLRGRRIREMWRNRSIKSTCIFVIISCIVCICYVVCPLIFSDTLIMMKNHDGSTSFYRLNILNLYLFGLDEPYNTYFNVFYIIETFSTTIYLLFTLIYYTVVKTMGFTLSSQLQMISTAFKSVGHKSFHSPNNIRNNEIKLTNGQIENNIAVYNELKKIIIDHQNILKKYNAFLSVFRPTMLVEVFVLSYSIIVFWFIFLMSLIEGDFMESLDTMAVTAMKACFSIPYCTFQMYMYCTVFDSLHNEKDSIIFGLYSCNWTEMDMKCKKLILLTMRMNNAHQQKLQYTRTRIINMEIFYQTMRVCYTIVNVLINWKKE